MLSAAPDQPALTDTQQLPRDNGGLMSRRLWLPKLLYDLLPWFYLLSGVLAFLATLYIDDWFWILPHYLLFSAACLHLGVAIFRRRLRRSRR